MPARVCYRFEPFEIDTARRRLIRAGEPVALSDRHLDVLLLLVARAGQITSKDDLLQAAWKDVAVGDNSLEQAISALRRVLGRHAGGAPYIETIARRGYRFAVPVTRAAAREDDEVLDGLLAPHRAFVEGRAALETLEAAEVVRARAVFERAVEAVPEHAAGHVGLANACVMQFEMTRTDVKPDRDALATAVRHAREACRLDPQLGEAWATLGLVLDRTGQRVDALAASRRAVSLEPDNWRHHFRLAYIAWGEERLRAASKTLALLPGFPLARWLAATVHVARQVLPDAERELKEGLAADQSGRAGREVRFSTVALHWLLGLVLLARGDAPGALEEFERELSAGPADHLYARECRANTWYAIGALRLRAARRGDAAAAFTRAIEEVPAHRLARLALLATGGDETVHRASPPGDPAGDTDHRATSVDAAMCRAVGHVLAGAHLQAAAVVDQALAEAAPGNAGWLLPLEPLLQVSSRADVWAGVLARLRNRAA